jgi:anti-sigma factor (TIGR02949 family)
VSEMLDCHSVMQQLWDYLDGELTAERMEAIRAHLVACQRCYPQYNVERAFLQAIAETRREYPQPEVVKSRVLAALRAAGFAG